MYILGLNAYHGDSSASIMKDGILIAATEEERITRIKHWAGLPLNAIQFCLEDAGITLKDIDYITISRDPKAKLSSKIIHSLKNRVSVKAILNRGKNSLKIGNILDEIAEGLGYKKQDLKAKLQFVEHHRSHLASAFHVSPFKKAALLSIDGMGDFTSTMRGIGTDNKIEVLDSVTYPHSLGIFYTSFTQYLGFPHYGDEYKVMGLSPYGEAKYSDKILNHVISTKDNGLFELNGDFFRHFKEGVNMSWDGGSPDVGQIFSEKFEETFGPARKKGEKLTQYHMDIAASVQEVCEEVLFHILNDLYNKTKLDNLCVAGGVAQNSVANGKMIRRTKFKNLFVPPAGHDAGTSVGSSLYFYHHVQDNKRIDQLPQPYTGAHFSNEDIKKMLDDRNIEYQEYTDSQLYATIAEKLADGAVVGWFQDRAEFGPRALGNRSILVDPRRKDAKDLLNKKIKKRESFRPFAPSILSEFTEEYFEQVDEVPFMEKVFDIKKEKHELIPAVTHVNGTGRLQTVDKKINPRYHKLISKFQEFSNVPILLNTSFNENEPIVNSPEHALDCYLRTNMDVLVLQNLVIAR